MSASTFLVGWFTAALVCGVWFGWVARDMSEDGKKRMTARPRRSWGDIYYLWLRKGVDHSYAAYRADEYEKRKNREARK